MACLPDDKIVSYLDGELASIEQSLIRDHLLLCAACRRKADAYAELHTFLAQPKFSEPPAWLVPRIMKRLYPETPRYASIAALIGASFVFFVSWIYIYFDFSRNSLIQALQLTADRTSGWLVNAIKGISAVYSSVQAVFKACNAFLRVWLDSRPIGAVLIAFALAFSGLLVVAMIRLLLKKPRQEKR
ncbi:MAG: zf-HC2 domain-containing protein [Candidatus Aminicenantes bacterium]|nr:zf-HC2 domain-containing protein [Candidatus Aminicenantes bacterium]